MTSPPRDVLPWANESLSNVVVLKRLVKLAGHTHAEWLLGQIELAEKGLQLQVSGVENRGHKATNATQ